MSIQKKQVESFLKKKDLRLTKERLRLFEGIQTPKGHFSVEDLIYQLRKKGLKISRDTVYRNLPLLLEAGVIRQSFRTHRDTVYEVVKDKPHHDHILCRKCGRLIEFADSKIEKAQAKIAKRIGFKLEHHQHQLVGLCPKCQK